MNLLILGRGKTGALVADAAHGRRHHVRVLCAAENTNASALTPEYLADINAVIDFTTPAAVVANAQACIRAGTSLVVGTTGWYDQVPQLREAVVAAKTGLLFGANFSIGMNLFFEIVQASAPPVVFYYRGPIFDRR